MRARIARAFRLGCSVYSAWQEDGGSRLGAALAYYTFFSMAPLVIILTAIVGLVFGERAARGEVFGQMRSLVGPEAAAAVQHIVARMHRPMSGGIAAVVGVATLILGASATVTELQGALNHIWKTPGNGGWWPVVRKRLISIALILGVGFLLLVSLVLNAGVAAAGDYFGAWAGVSGRVLDWSNSLISFGIVTLLFAAIFKWLPNAEIEWREVWLGAGATALFFAGGKHVIGRYLGRKTITPYGAAGSIVLVLLWVYYSAQILYLGAEFTKVHARARGRPDPPRPAPEPARVHPAWLRERRAGRDRRRTDRRSGDRRAAPRPAAAS